MGLHEGSQQLQTHRHGLGKQSSLHLIDTLALDKRSLQKLAHPVELFLGLEKVSSFVEIMIGPLLAGFMETWNRTC